MLTSVFAARCRGPRKWPLTDQLLRYDGNTICVTESRVAHLKLVIMSALTAVEKSLITLRLPPHPVVHINCSALLQRTVVSRGASRAACCDQLRLRALMSSFVLS